MNEANYSSTSLLFPGRQPEPSPAGVVQAWWSRCTAVFCPTVHLQGLWSLPRPVDNGAVVPTRLVQELPGRPRRSVRSWRGLSGMQNTSLAESCQPHRAVPHTPCLRKAPRIIKDSQHL
ncbi:unnamed protein product [Boreogadus saida]